MPKFDTNKETEEVKRLYGDRLSTPVEDLLSGEELRKEAHYYLDAIFNQEQVDTNINTPKGGNQWSYLKKG